MKFTTETRQDTEKREFQTFVLLRASVSPWFLIIFREMQAPSPPAHASCAAKLHIARTCGDRGISPRCGKFALLGRELHITIGVSKAVLTREVVPP